MDWKLLLSSKRFSKIKPWELQQLPNDPFRTDFEADYDRVIYSTPFRRLARKTQVHPMALNDHIHTRLTHSLEVASVGRSLGHRLTTFLKAKCHLPTEVTEQDVLWIIQAACLAHDIGNPPFGHAGEYAIRHWISEHRDWVFGPSDSVTKGVRDDLLTFEGNAQGFRLAARGDNPATGYLRLTIATLGAMIKYPWTSSDPRVEKKKKFNIFSTETELFDLMSDAMGLRLVNRTSARHPLSFLTEAADDICYRILDIEDAVEMRIVPESRVRGIYCSLSGDSTSGTQALGLLRGKAIAALIRGVWDVFENDYDSIQEGSRSDDLKSGLGTSLSGPLNSIKSLYQEIFAERSKIAAELGALKALGRIVSALCRATATLADKKKFDDCGFVEQRCLELAWSREYASTHEGERYEWWLHQVIDYVSGLTDNYARQLSREIEGT